MMVPVEGFEPSPEPGLSRLPLPLGYAGKNGAPGWSRTNHSGFGDQTPVPLASALFGAQPRNQTSLPALRRRWPGSAGWAENWRARQDSNLHFAGFVVRVSIQLVVHQFEMALHP